jgi:hypothetical protein
MHVNGKMIFFETIPVMVRRGYEGEEWRGCIQVQYI